jgi:hypothetical protein
MKIKQYEELVAQVDATQLKKKLKLLLNIKTDEELEVQTGIKKYRWHNWSRRYVPAEAIIYLSENFNLDVYELLKGNIVKKILKRGDDELIDR